MLGSYKIEDSQENKNYFFRVSSRIGFGYLEKEIIEKANSEAIKTPLGNEILMTTIFKNQQNEYRADLRPFIQGQHYTGNQKEFDNLIRSIGKLHKSLKENNFSEKIKLNWSSRVEEWKKTLSLLKTNSASFDPYNEFIKKNAQLLENILKGYVDSLEFFDKEAGPQHGEIHRGNVIFNCNQPIFIDFEEATQVWTSPYWDYAYIATQFCFEKEKIIKERIEFLIKKQEIDYKKLSRMIKLISTTAILIILSDFLKGVINPIEELEKILLEYKNPTL